MVHAARGPGDDHRRGPPGRRLARHGIQGPQRPRRHQRSARPSGSSEAAEQLGYQPNALARGPADRPQLHRRADHHRQLRPVQHPGHAGRRGRARPGPHLGLPVRQPRRPDPRAALPADAAGTPGGRHHRDRAPPGPARADRPGPAGPGGLRDDPLERPGGPLAGPRRRGRRCPGRPAPAQHRDGRASATSRGRAGSGRPVLRAGGRGAGAGRGGAGAGRRARPLYGEWTEEWGRQARTCSLRAAPGLDAIFCGNDQIARGVADAAARGRPAGSRGRGPGRLRQLGVSSPPPAGRRSPPWT